MLQIMLAQFTRKGFGHGKPGVARLAADSPLVQASRALPCAMHLQHSRLTQRLPSQTGLHAVHQPAAMTSET